MSANNELVLLNNCASWCDWPAAFTGADLRDGGQANTSPDPIGLASGKLAVDVDGRA